MWNILLIPFVGERIVASCTFRMERPEQLSSPVITIGAADEQRIINIAKCDVRRGLRDRYGQLASRARATAASWDFTPSLLRIDWIWLRTVAKDT